MNANRHAKFQPWTRQQVIQEIRERARRKLPLNSRIMGSREGMALHAVAKRVFGSWRRALRSAKLNHNQFLGPVRKKWTPQRTITEVRKWFQQHPQRSPRGSKLDNRWHYLLELARRYFPDPKIRRKRIGIPYYFNKWTPEVVIKCLKERARKGQAINTMTILEENRFLYRAARTYFGSYRSAVKAAGFNFEAIRSTIKGWHYVKARKK